MSDQSSKKSSHKSSSKRSHRREKSSGTEQAPMDEAFYAKRKSAADFYAKLAKDEPEFSTDPDADLRALDAITVSDDTDPLIAKPIVRANETVCGLYAKIREYAREANVSLATPEVVFVGETGSGKSLLMSAVMGIPEITMPEPNARSVSVRLSTSDSGKTITVQRESVSSTAVSEALKKHNHANTEPIEVVVESNEVLDAVFIDTPGLIVDPNNSDSVAHEAAAVAAMKPAHRLIVVVRRGWDATRPCTSFDYIRDTVQKVDPQFTRTIVVYTSLSQQIERIQSTREVNQFLGVTVPNVPTFFVTQPTAEQRARIGDDSAVLDEKLRQAAKRDRTNLERIRYNKNYTNRIGVPSVISHVSKFVLKAHQCQIPKIDVALRAKVKASARALERITERGKAVDGSNYFRILASDYSMLYLKTLRGLLHGTIDGTPAVNGQSLEQEKTMCGIDGQWVDGSGLPIATGTMHVPMEDNRLFGGQQFERLLSEFRIMAEQIPVPDISVDDIATGGGASGIPSLRNAPNLTWAASDLARQKTQEIFEPLVEQLGSRAGYVLKRLSEIAESIIDDQKRNRGEDESADDDSFEDYTYFVHFVRDKFTTFVDETIKNCVSLCLDEFYSTRTVCWDVSESHVADGVEEGNVKALAIAVFDILRKRIVNNVLLKFYQNLVVPFDNDLWDNLQREVSELDDDTLKQHFSSESVVQAINSKKEDITMQHEEAEKKVTDFNAVASKFAHSEHLEQ